MDTPEIYKMVIADIRERDKIGRQRYGRPLTSASNGRSSLQDAYEEVLDLAIYLRQFIEQRRETASPTACPQCNSGVYQVGTMIKCAGPLELGCHWYRV